MQQANETTLSHISGSIWNALHVMRAACRGSHAAFPLHAVRGFDAKRGYGLRCRFEAPWPAGAGRSGRRFASERIDVATACPKENSYEIHK
jgi:hypothetical protein